MYNDNKRLFYSRKCLQMIQKQIMREWFRIEQNRNIPYCPSLRKYTLRKKTKIKIKLSKCLKKPLYSCTFVTLYNTCSVFQLQFSAVSAIHPFKLLLANYLPQANTHVCSHRHTLHQVCASVQSGTCGEVDLLLPGWKRNSHSHRRIITEH